MYDWTIGVTQQRLSYCTEPESVKMADYRFETLNEREIVELQKATKTEISFIFKFRLLELKFYRGNYWLL